MRVLGAVLIAGVALGGCGRNAGADSAKPAVTIPAFVGTMIDAEFPADGQIHVQTTGTFEMKATSLECIAEPEIAESLARLDVHFAGVGIDDVYKHLGQPHRLENSRSRRGQLNVNCIEDDTNQVVRWVLRNGRNGKPYRLTLAVWQRDAAWVGSVERMDVLHPQPRVAHPIDGGVIPKDVFIRGSVEVDGFDLRNIMIRKMEVNISRVL